MAIRSWPVRKPPCMGCEIRRSGRRFQGANARAYGRTPLGPAISGAKAEGDPPMTIKVGDKVPNVTITEATAEGPKPVQTDEFFKGKTVALFALPGAFTPTCSAKHLPGFKQLAPELKNKGV